MSFEPDQAELELERVLIYGLLDEVEGLANGSKYSPGKVPTTLIFQSPNNEGERLTVGVDKIMEICGGDMEQTIQACRNLSVAINAKAQMLVFEKELKGELAPPAEAAFCRKPFLLSGAQRIRLVNARLS